MRRYTPLSIISLITLLAVTGCADVKESLTNASQAINEFVGYEEDGTKASGASSGERKVAKTDDRPAEVPSAKPRKQTARASSETPVEQQYRLGREALKAGRNQTAFEHFVKAGKEGHEAAAYEVAMAYRDGRGVAENREKSDQWLRTAANLGDPRAQYLLGAAYYGGIDVEQDYSEALDHLRPAAESGHPQAQYLVGECYSNGRGVTKNSPWAARWYAKAANQGLADAQFALGAVQAAGVGMPADLVKGYSWLTLASLQGHEQAVVLRLALAKRMSPDQIRKAELIAGKFAAKPDKGTLRDEPTVMYVQQVLNTLGHDAGSVDGVMGPQTRNAIRDYQKQSGLESDGNLSPVLLEKLNKETAQGGG